jgi:oligoribonuclease (3'-5' exoribonuclease)
MFHFGAIAPKMIEKNPAATFAFEAKNMPSPEAANEAVLQLTTKFAPFGLLTPMPSPKSSESPREDGVADCADTGAESVVPFVSVTCETLSAQESETFKQSSMAKTETRNHILSSAQPTISTTPHTTTKLPSNTTEKIQVSQEFTPTTAIAALCGPSMLMDALFTTKDFPPIPSLIQDTPRYVEEIPDYIEELSWAPKLVEAEPSEQDMAAIDDSCASSEDLVRTDSGVLMEDAQMRSVDFSVQGLADCRLDTTVAMDRETSITTPSDGTSSSSERTLYTTPTIASPKDEPLSGSEDTLDTTPTIPTSPSSPPSSSTDTLPTTIPADHFDRPPSANEDIYPTSISSGTYWSAIGLSRGPSALPNPNAPIVEIVLATLYPIWTMKTVGAAQNDGEERLGTLRDVLGGGVDELD